MKMGAKLLAAPLSALVALSGAMASTAHAQAANMQGWLGTETIQTPVGKFDFKGGYPTDESAKRLDDALLFNRAVEVYLDQMPAVSVFQIRKGLAEGGAREANQFAIWETLMDARTLLLTGNSETVYGMTFLDLKRDGPTVIDAPPALLGGLSDMWQGEVLGIGPTGPDKGKGGKFLVLPPDYTGTPPPGYMVAKSRTYGVWLGVRGFLVDGKPDKPVALMKSIKIYPLSKASHPPAMSFINGSGRDIDTVFPDTYAFFEDLAQLVEQEPTDLLSPNERFELASIGIEKGKPFHPDADQKAQLISAVRLASAIARANTFASNDPARLIYPDRRWEWLFIGGSASWDSQGYVNTDRRAAFAYAAIGMSPAMVLKIVGAGSQYYWTPRDSTGAYLDGGKSYRLHLPPNIPVKNFWSVVVYDASSRSMLQNGEKFPTVSQYTGPNINADGSVDIYFGPTLPKGKEKNWIRTVNGKGWFPIIRFYGPLQPFFDKSWKPDDIVEMK
jgi:hypothetical protein